MCIIDTYLVAMVTAGGLYTLLKSFSVLTTNSGRVQLEIKVGAGHTL